MKGKLKSRYIGSFKILQRIRDVALSHMHCAFHVTILRKYELDPIHVISFDDIELEEDATYIEKLVRIMV